MKKNTCFFVAIAMIVPLLASCGILPAEEEFQTAPIVKEYEGANYGKTAVERGDLVESDEITLKYKGTETAKVKMADPKEIKKVYVKKGSKVKQGQLLIRCKYTNLEKQIANDEFKIATNQLKIKQEKELMNQEIKKQKKVDNSAKQIKSIREQHAATISSYETEIKIMNIELKQFKKEIKEGDVEADISGTIKSMNAGLEGTTPEADKTIMTIEGKQKNWFQTSTDYAEDYKEGQSVTISVGNKNIRGTIIKGKSEDTLMIRPNTTSGLNYGDVGSLKYITKQRKNVLYLPSAVVYKMDDKHIVYVENDKGIKTMKEVEVGVEIDRLTEIKSGLSEGEQVIIN